MILIQYLGIYNYSQRYCFSVIVGKPVTHKNCTHSEHSPLTNLVNMNYGGWIFMLGKICMCLRSNYNVAQI